MSSVGVQVGAGMLGMAIPQFHSHKMLAICKRCATREGLCTKKSTHTHTHANNCNYCMVYIVYTLLQVRFSVYWKKCKVRGGGGGGG